MSQDSKKKTLLDIFHETEEGRLKVVSEERKITLPESEKDVYFSMRIGIHDYKVKLWRDSFRGIDVFDTNGDKLYALTFSEHGDGRFVEGFQMKGRENYFIKRDNFGTFALRYSDHIQWFAGNLDTGLCEEVSELFTIGY